MKYFRWFLIAGYVYFILTKTIFFRIPYPKSIFHGLFWEIQQGYWKDIMLNMALFIPLGFLIGGWKGLLVGLFLSCGIEGLQFFSRLGICEVDDVLHNTIGAGVGAGIHKAVFIVLNKVGKDRIDKGKVLEK